MTDLVNEYTDHRIHLAQASAADELLARVRGASSEGVTSLPATAPAAALEPDAEGSMVGRTAKDIGKGIVETPRGVLKGARDAVQNTVDMAKEMGDYIEQKLGLPVFMIDGNGIHVTDNAGAKGHRLSDLAELPDLDAPKTVTGGLVKSVAQFLTGMKGVGRISGFVKGGAIANTLKGAAANYAAFDPHQARLSNLIQQVPALENPITGYLASDPNDSDAEGRFKNALEGTGLGALSDGLFRGVRLLKQVKTAQSAAVAAEGAPGQLKEDAFRLLGEETTGAKEKLVRTRPVEPTVAAPGEKPPEVDPAKLGKAAPAEEETFINFARIDTSDDVKRAMQELADASKPAIDSARRGTQTFEQIKLNAQQRDAWKDLQSRRAGDPMNAEQSVAARQLWVSSANKLTEIAEAAAQNPSEANLFAFRKMLATHDTIQQQVIAARTETARALASWRIPAGGSAERLRDVTAALDANGGADMARQLAERVSKLGKAGMVKEMGAVAEKTAYATSRDALLEGWINGLLSNPKTHIVNMTSNAAVTALRIAERGVAGKIANVLGDSESVALGEASQQYAGLIDSIPDAFRYASKSARTGESGFGTGKLETAREGSITSDAFNLSSEGWLGRAVDMIGSVARVPGRALTAEDEFFKTVGYRMELRAQAHRQAVSEVSAGKIEPDGVAARTAELVENPPESLRMASVDSAQYQTFTNAPGEFAKRITQLTNHYPGLKVILPFVKTPANIMRFTFERTPLAPLMSQFRQNVAAGGARRDLALAQMGLGTTIMLSTADLAMQGKVTGSGPVEKGTREAMTRQGWQPYSVQMGDRWYSYNRLDPLGSLLGMSADVVDALKNSQHESLDDGYTEQLVTATALAVGGNLVNKTYLSGLSNLFEALSDPQQYGEAKIQGLVGSVIPSAVGAAARVEDPYARQVYSMLDTLKSRTPGLSSTLPPRRNLWGEPVSYESGFGKAFDALSPVASRKPNADPIDKELLRLDSNLTPPGRKTSFDGVTVDLSQYPEIYSRYLELAGNGLKSPAWGLGAKDLLNKIVKGDHPLSAVYRLKSDGPDGGKDVFIRDTVRKYREQARAQLLKEYPALAADVREKQAKQREMKLPVMQ